MSNPPNDDRLSSHVTDEHGEAPTPELRALADSVMQVFRTKVKDELAGTSRPPSLLRPVHDTDPYDPQWIEAEIGAQRKRMASAHEQYLIAQQAPPGDANRADERTELLGRQEALRKGITLLEGLRFPPNTSFGRTEASAFRKQKAHLVRTLTTLVELENVAANGPKEINSIAPGPATPTSAADTLRLAAAQREQAFQVLADRLQSVSTHDEVFGTNGLLRDLQVQSDTVRQMLDALDYQTELEQSRNLAGRELADCTMLVGRWAEWAHGVDAAWTMTSIAPESWALAKALGQSVLPLAELARVTIEMSGTGRSLAGDGVGR